jgi:hypothetical protein
MSDEKRRSPDADDRAIERDIRSQRKFSIAEAIGRSAGDLLKGASPVTRRRQAEIEIELFLERHLADADGALLAVLLRRVRDSETLMAAGYNQPLAALAEATSRLLASDDRLRRFVGSVDSEWGRMYSERPRFERAEGPAAQDDPYTIASVRESLSDLLDRLREDQDPD